MSTFVEGREFVVVNCGTTSSGGCGMDFAMPRWFYDETRKTGRGWHCPAGHGRAWSGKTTEEKLRDAEARERHLQDQLQAATDDAEHTRRVLVRERSRFANGVCPCCNRSFTNVRRHIATKHPDYDVTRVEAADHPFAFACTCGRKFDSFRGLRIHQGKRHDPTAKPGSWRSHLTKV